MDDHVEQRVRQSVADHLGVDTHELTAEVSLTDDLAADSLDLAELALGLEEEFMITVPDRVLGDVRTYGDLVGAVLLLTHPPRRVAGGAAEIPPVFGPGMARRRAVA